MRLIHMQAYFDSPETIRNKVKEFKTATFNGLNRQDVMNYLSVLSEQQSVMIKLLKDNNVPLLVDDGYEQEEQFSKPSIEGQEYLSQYLNAPSSSSKLQEENLALKEELEKLRNSMVTTNQSENPISDFDFQFGNNAASNNNFEIEEMQRVISEKESYIVELEKAISSSNNGVTDLERQVYDEQIENLKARIEELESTPSNTPDMFETEVVKIDESVISVYEEEISKLKQQLDETLTYINNDNSAETINALNNTIGSLNNKVSDLENEVISCTELLENAKKELESKKYEVQNNTSNDVSTSTVTEADVAHLNAKIEILEIEVSKKEKEKASYRIKLDEITSELHKFKNFKDSNGNIITLDPTELLNKYNEVKEIESNLKTEQHNLDSKIESLRSKEALIEANKQLISEDYVSNINAREKEVDRLQKQMERMLTIAQITADDTIKEAEDKSNLIIEKANLDASELLKAATEEKHAMIEEANITLTTAKEFKSSTEEELAQFREETRRNAEDLILDSQSKADAILAQAQEDAQKAQDDAISEVDAIMEQANLKITEIDQVIQTKQKEIDNMQTYYLKVKSDGLVDIKKLYNQLENIIYSDDLS